VKLSFLQDYLLGFILALRFPVSLRVCYFPNNALFLLSTFPSLFSFLAVFFGESDNRVSGGQVFRSPHVDEYYFLLFQFFFPRFPLFLRFNEDRLLLNPNFLGNFPGRHCSLFFWALQIGVLPLLFL